MNAERFNRQELLFGPVGQTKIESKKITIVGLGGIGSHVVQQLAYMGFQKFILIDPDTLESSNLNRVVGAFPKDVGKQKIEISARLINRVNSNAAVSSVAEPANSYHALNEIEKSDFLVGCVDNDAARLSLVHISSALAIPYMDVATQIYPEDKIIGGQIFYSTNGQGCLMCAGLLSQEEIRKFNSSQTDLEFEKSVYGLNSTLFKERGPAVVSLNGLLASLVATELMIGVTGLGKPSQYITLKRYLYGSWVRGKDDILSNPNCFYCKEVFGNRNYIKLYLQDKAN